jgi:tyrocidine synthetase-3
VILVSGTRTGTISLAGRKDNQVKISGYRIELGEIDSVIMKYPSVEKSITVAVDVRNKKRLVSYFTASKDVNVQDILEFLNEKLAFYMVPYKLIKLDSIPLTSNGKVDKKALPEFSVDEKKDINEPINVTQKRLHGIWLKLFGLSKIDIYDNFFHIGGDSLLAIKLVSRIYEEFNVRLSIEQIFNNPSIKSLSEIIDTSSTLDNNFVIPKSETQDAYPVSSAQRRIYLANNLDKDSYLYNICGGILFSTMPNVIKLQNALDTIISRHDILRSYFEFENSQIKHKVSNNFNIRIDPIDVCTNDIKELFYIYQSKFSLDKAPLFNVFLFRLPNGKALFMLDIHHIIFDGASLDIFMNELSLAYNEKSLPELAISYKDFAIWESKQLENDNFASSKKFWIEQFKDKVPVLNLPYSFSRPIKKNYAGKTFTLPLPEGLLSKLNKFANSKIVTPYMVMLACYYILLYNYANEEDLVIGTPVSGRIYKELENILGMFVNSIPLRCKVNPNIKFKDFLENVKQISANAFAHQDYPFDMLVNDLKLPRTAGRNPLFDTMFVFQNHNLSNFDFDKVNAKIVSSDTSLSKFDISLEISLEGENLSLKLEYSTELFDEIFISNFAKAYERIFTFVLDNEETLIMNIPVFESSSKIFSTSNVYKFNEIILEDSPKPILFEKQVETNPSASNVEMQIAGVFENLLNIKNINIDDNFFDLGGDSLSAITLQIELLKLNFNLTYSDIFECPTIRELAKKVSA